MADDRIELREGVEVSKDVMLNQNRWYELESMLIGIASGNAAEDAISALYKRDLGKSFLLWGRFVVSPHGFLREAADDSVWRFYKLANLAGLKAIWNQVPADAREYLIRKIFEYHPGQPFESIREARVHFERHGPLLSPLVVGYVPSMRVRALRRMVEEADDPEGLRLIDELIDERRAACEIGARILARQRGRWVLSADQRELGARLMTMARRAGFRSAVLPEIEVSYDAPPVFVSNSELEEVEAADSQANQVRRGFPGIASGRPRRSFPSKNCSVAIARRPRPSSYGSVEFAGPQGVTGFPSSGWLPWSGSMKSGTGLPTSCRSLARSTGHWSCTWAPRKRCTSAGPS